MKTDQRTTTTTPPADFHCALLWLRSLEILTGCSQIPMLEELETPNLFTKYASPYKA